MGPAHTKKGVYFFLIFVLLFSVLTSSVTWTFAEFESSAQEEETKNTVEKNIMTIEQDEEVINTIIPLTDNADLFLTITSPENNYITNEMTVIFEGTYEKLASNQLLKLEIQSAENDTIIENIQLTDLPNGNWSKELYLLPGLYEYYLQVYDENGPIDGAKSEERNLVIHTLPPHLTVETPEGEWYTNKLFFSGTWEPTLEVDSNFDIKVTPEIGFYLSNDVKQLMEMEEPTVLLNLDEKEYSEEDEKWDWTLEYNEELEVWEWEVSLINSIDNIKTFEDGVYYFYLKTEDAVGNVAVAAEETGTDEGANEILIEPYETTYSTSRPYISPNVSPHDKETMVSTDTAIEFVYISKIPPVDDFDNIIEVNGGDITGSIDYEINIIVSEDGGEIYYVEILFTPDEELDYYTRYDVTINPLYKDPAENPINPRIWSFTTESDGSKPSAHKVIENNTNSCATCHSTHTANDINLIRGLLPHPLNEYTEEELEPVDSMQAYCLACHDGTVASPVSNMDLKLHESGNFNTHGGRIVNDDGVRTIGGCVACHDPHVETFEGNQNPHHLQSRFSFNHPDGTFDLDGNEVGFQDSKVRLCETCHIDNDIYDEDSGTKFSLFRYENSNSPVEFGTVGELDNLESYSLCLRCHNEEYRKMAPNVIDIMKYYKIGETEFSGHFITNDRVQNGDLLNGNLACSDCHSKHGSVNEKLINTMIGHENPKEFLWSQNDSRVDQERAFCLSCHNKVSEFNENKATRLYGITPMFENSDIPEHEDEKTSCAQCHGGPDKEFIRAVHAPTKGKP